MTNFTIYAPISGKLTVSPDFEVDDVEDLQVALELNWSFHPKGDNTFTCQRQLRQLLHTAVECFGEVELIREYDEDECAPSCLRATVSRPIECRCACGGANHGVGETGVVLIRDVVRHENVGVTIARLDSDNIVAFAGKRPTKAALPPAIRKRRKEEERAAWYAESRRMYEARYGRSA